MPSPTQQRGQQAEAIVVKYLAGKEYKVIQRNYSTRFGEIDLIVKDKLTQELVFVEVKSSSQGANYSYPEEYVTKKKKKRLLASAKVYLVDHCLDLVANYRFDVVTVDFNKQGSQAMIRHYKGIEMF